MAEVFNVEPVVRICAVISADDRIRNQAINRLSENWGEIMVQSPCLPFEAGGYYAESMGHPLKKQLVAFGDPIDGGTLADWKLWTNAVERDFAGPDYPSIRPLNLDPGYVTQAKLVLATTKNRDHRVYLRDGIFGEITLTYTAKRWVHHRWTYPDYRTEAVAAFATQCRDHLRDHLLSRGMLRRRPTD
ncbi:DUF4416 family protein [Roseiconus nitratireducens]|uniref:DUF4416 family protein n=1 Tax=Roseiconus nitratireducens TaxID=2605748 RepID=A0A5M6CYR7_9BACT|nr:DUF4416 family protein [Roseiconus nitratireducens]KAA5540253.1 DUF4416 family protein [Roseiconus nitratireducens]